MFSKGQLIFAAVFATVFIILMVWSYRKDIKLHQMYYKKVWLVALGIFLVITLFAILTFSLH
jgi:magnesium-transporting ATPase (P-type)